MSSTLRSFFLSFLVTTLSFFTLTASAQTTTDAYTAAGLTKPTVSSDKDDYAPGEVAIIRGTGWTLDSIVNVHLEETPDYAHHHDYHDTKVKADGTWEILYPIEERHLGVKFEVIVEGQTSKYNGYAYFTDGHTFTSLSPTFGPTAGGTSVTINGSGFSNQVIWKVKFDLTEVTATRHSSNVLFAITPAHAAGAVNVSVSSSVTDAVTLPNSYTYTGTTATSLVVSSASGTFGGTTNVTATLISGSPATGVNGKSINFSLNGTSVGAAITNASGIATLTNVSLIGINAGTYAIGVGASFNEDATYAASSGTNSLTVNKATPVITFLNPADITYGTVLSATQLNATATLNSSSVAGTFNYTPASGTVMNAG